MPSAQSSCAAQKAVARPVFAAPQFVDEQPWRDSVDRASSDPTPAGDSTDRSINNARANDAIANNGYVRVPRAWVSLPVSPGAKALLLHLCSAANAKGESWYSYAQLGEIVMRSRAAISGYVDELREIGVVTTERQRMANGFNYRLRIRLPDWETLNHRWADLARKKALARQAESSAKSQGSPPAAGRPAQADQIVLHSDRAHAGTASPPKSCVSPSERRIQPVERKDPSGPKNNHNQNKTRPDPKRSRSDLSAVLGSATDRVSGLWSESDEKSWAEAKWRENDGSLDFDSPPSDALLHRAISAYDGMRKNQGSFVSDEEARQAATKQVTEFARKYRLNADSDHVREAAEVVASHARSQSSLRLAISLIEESWQPHWRRLSTPFQLDKLISEARRENPTILGDHRHISRFARRALMARRELDQRQRTAQALAARRPDNDQPSPSTPALSPKEVPSRSRISPQIERMVTEFLHG